MSSPTPLLLIITHNLNFAFKFLDSLLESNVIDPLPRETALSL